MSGPKHTPGPWVAQRRYFTVPDPDMKVMTEDGALYIAAVEFSDDPEHVSFVKDVEQMRANARLIAAAPELLEACVAMAAWDAAENNAKPYDDDNGAGFYQRMAMCAEAFDKARAAIAKALGSTAC